MVRRTFSGREVIGAISGRHVRELICRILELLAEELRAKAAFGATRRAVNFGLVRLRGRVGLRAYSVLLSVVHWLVRASFGTTVSYIVEETGNVSQELTDHDIDFPPLSADDISKVLPQETSSTFPDLDLSDYPPSISRVESTADSIIDSTTETLLIAQYGGSGIIEEETDDSEKRKRTVMIGAFGICRDGDLLIIDTPNSVSISIVMQQPICADVLEALELVLRVVL